jgi:hypothetical protein
MHLLDALGDLITECDHPIGQHSPAIRSCLTTVESLTLAKSLSHSNSENLKFQDCDTEIGIRIERIPTFRRIECPEPERS